MNDLEGAIDPNAIRRARARSRSTNSSRDVIDAAARRRTARSERARSCAYDADREASALPLRLFRRGKVRDVYVVDDDATAARCHGPRERLRRRDGRDDSAQGRGPHADHRVVARDSSSAMSRTTCYPPTPPRSSREVPPLASARARDRWTGDALPADEVFPIECVMRGYISGSAWKEYRERGTLAGEPLPEGLREAIVSTRRCSAPRPRPRRVTTRTSPSGGWASWSGAAPAAELERLTREVYDRGRAIAAERGIIIADTKFEFGRRSRSCRRKGYIGRRGAHTRQLALLARGQI